jgi:hypothetical protein
MAMLAGIRITIQAYASWTRTHPICCSLLPLVILVVPGKPSLDLLKVHILAVEQYLA